MMRAMAGLFETLTFVGGLIGILALGSTLLSLAAGKGNDVTLAAASAFAVAATAIPYCIAGVFHRNAMRQP
jgi:hypothetical protein